MASSPWVTSATVDVTTVERLSQTYLYQIPLGLGSGNNSLLLHGKYNADDLRNLATGVGLNLPISCVQILNRKGDHKNVGASRAVVAHAFNPSTLEAAAGGSL